MVNATSFKLLNFEVTYIQLAVTIFLVVLILIATIAFRKNIRIQMRVSKYMDNECGIYNRNGLEKYIYKNRKKLTTPSLVVISMRNLSLIAKNYKKNLPYDVASLLISKLGKDETIGRLAYHKFLLVLKGRSKDDIRHLCAEIDSELDGEKAKFDTDVNFITLYGINENPGLDNPSQSITLTDYSTKYSKIREKNMFFYGGEVNDALTKKDKINELKQAALEERRIVSFIQPKVSLATGKVVGGEILCRWLDEGQKPVYFPDEFIPVFEENGFVKEVDMLMLENAAKLAATLVRNGYPDIMISVNLSKINFESKDLATTIKNKVVELGAMPKNIELEITETTIMDNSSFVSNCIMELRQLGFKVAMDDFGKEYSSLGSLSSNPFDIIKLDSIFFRDGLTTEKTRGIVRDILHMLSKLDYEVVCEGIETKEEVNIIGSINPNVIIQGYYFSKPIPVYEFESFIRTTYEFDFEPEDIIEFESDKENITNNHGLSDERVKDLEEKINQMQKELMKHQSLNNSQDNKNQHQNLYGNSYYGYGAPYPQQGMPQQPYGYGAPYPQQGMPQQPYGYGAPYPQQGMPQQPYGYGMPYPQQGMPQNSYGFAQPNEASLDEKNKNFSADEKISTEKQDAKESASKEEKATEERVVEDNGDNAKANDDKKKNKKNASTQKQGEALNKKKETSNKAESVDENKVLEESKAELVEEAKTEETVIQEQEASLETKPNENKEEVEVIEPQEEKPKAKKTKKSSKKVEEPSKELKEEKPIVEEAKEEITAEAKPVENEEVKEADNLAEQEAKIQNQEALDATDTLETKEVEAETTTDTLETEEVEEAHEEAQEVSESNEDEEASSKENEEATDNSEDDNKEE